jgi:hypothetical protein
MDASEDPPRKWGKRWMWAAAASACICVLWFSYLNRDGCWLYLGGTRAIGIFAIPWLWLMLMFGFKTTGRMVLLGFTLLGLFFMPNVTRPPATAAAEVSAIARLRELRSDLETYRLGNNNIVSLKCCRASGLRSGFGAHIVSSTCPLGHPGGQ